MTWAMIVTPATIGTAPMTSKKTPERTILVMGIMPEPYTIAFGGLETGSMKP